MYRGMFYKQWCKTTKTYFRVYDPTIRLRPQYSNFKKLQRAAMKPKFGVTYLTFPPLEGITAYIEHDLMRPWFFYILLKENGGLWDHRRRLEYRVSWKCIQLCCGKFYLTFWLREREHRIENAIRFHRSCSILGRMLRDESVTFC